MSKELAKTYDPKGLEDRLYQKWLDKGYFHATVNPNKKPFTIMMPPPNVTGQLHMGHALDNTMQDILCRFKRMEGYEVLWQPGTDHAAIATEVKVTNMLKEQGIDKDEIGREKFLEHCWEWKKEYGGRINSQLRKIGSSADWERERFTMDEGCSKAVQEVFIKLYEKGYIYQGKRIINWDPVQRTALSNIEVIHKEIEGAMYYFKYKIVDSDQELVIATTRPETMFADQAIFVHPDDERYKDLVGKYAINPANGEKLPIMADSYIDIDFGTAVMKCTPAHDPNDFALAKKYNLDMPICMNDDGTMNELCHKYQGMDRFECRKQLVADFEAAGIVDHIEKHLHQVGHSERSGAIVEPYLSKQWFVKMKPLAEAALANQKKDSKVNFVPERFEKTFTQWMENIEDWCISRQLWWGHQVPAWYHKETGEVYVGKTAPEDIENWTQDEDVLDTWFSSALWPFSTLGWPNTEDPLFKRYFPTNTLVTGYDIIFFWVSRMIFQSLEFTGQRPFEHVLIHGLIRDEQGRKMSKSLGNGVDPMDVIDQYGADTLRFFLTTNSAPGMDLRYIPEKLEASWNFINKIWNSARFVLMNIDEDLEYKDLKFDHLNNVIEEVDANMDKFEFVNVGSELYKFIWDDFCSWYIELTKVHLNSDNEVEKQASAHTLVYLLNAIVRMLHPFMPFVTEEIYQAIPHLEESICISKYPTVNPDFNDENINRQFTYLMDIVKGVREIRANYTIKNAIEVEYSIETKDENLQALLDQCVPYLKKLCNATCVGYNQKASKDIATAMIQGGNTLIVELGAYVDKEAEKQKLQAELQKLEGEIKRCTNMLSNEKFVSKAPQAKVDSERQKLEDYTSKYNAVKEKLAAM